MFLRLFGMLVSGLVIAFPVVHGGRTVRVRGEFMKFSSSLVRVIWHGFSILGSPSSLERSQCLHCAILDSHANRHRIPLLPLSDCKIDILVHYREVERWMSNQTLS
jgi:hypothetical protein